MGGSFCCLGKKLVPGYLNSSKFLQRILTKKASEKSALPKFFPIIREALLLFNGVANVKKSMADVRFYTKMQWKTDCRVPVSMQVVSGAWSALSKFIRLRSF